MNRRRMPLVLALAAVLILASLCWYAPLSRTSQAAPVPSGETAFKGKVLLVHTNNMMSVFLLEKAQVRKIGERSCLVGTGAADSRPLDWSKGRRVWLPMEHIVSITEFDQLNEAKKALKSGGGMPFGGSVVPVGAGTATEPAPAAPAPAGAPEPAPVRR